MDALGLIYFINNNIVKGFLLTAVKCGTTRTFFKKGLLAFKTTFKNLTSEYFPLKKKKRKQRVCNINKLLYNKQYTRRHHRGGFFFLPVEMDKIVKQSRLWVEFRVKTPSLLDGAPVSTKRCVSFIQIQIYQCRIVKEKKEKVTLLHKFNCSSSPPRTTSCKILRKQSK